MTWAIRWPPPMPERIRAIDYGQTRVDERLLATMSDEQRHIFFDRLRRKEAARLKGTPATEIAQAVMNWGKAAAADPLIYRPSIDPVNRRSARPQKPHQA